MLLITNALIVNADKAETKKQDILIDKGRIVKIGPSLKAAGAKTLDAGGKHVFPGFIDLHVHFREPGREDKETIATGSAAAAKGGFTTVMCMPNTTPVIDNAMIVEGIIKEGRRVGLTNVIPVGAVTRGQEDQDLTDMFELKNAGCLALSDDGKSVNNARVMRMALEYAEMAGLLVIEHCEDPFLSAKGVMNEGDISTLLGLKGDPEVSETVIVARDIELAHYLKTKVHLAHISSARSVELIRQAKAQGIAVTAEACPHHFTLTDDSVRTFDPNTKVNPPLRNAQSVAELKRGLQDGTIDCIVTDHAPHTFEDKETGFDDAPCGMIGLETAVGLVVSELVSVGVLTLEQMAEKMSAAPARIVGLKQKGAIEEGYDADLVVVDIQKQWELKKQDIVSKSKNTPFIGRKMQGEVLATVMGGKVVYREGKIAAK